MCMGDHSTIPQRSPASIGVWRRIARQMALGGRLTSVQTDSGFVFCMTTFSPPKPVISTRTRTRLATETVDRNRVTDIITTNHAALKLHPIYPPTQPSSWGVVDTQANPSSYSSLYRALRASCRRADRRSTVNHQLLGPEPGGAAPSDAYWAPTHPRQARHSARSRHRPQRRVRQEAQLDQVGT